MYDMTQMFGSNIGLGANQFSARPNYNGPMLPTSNLSPNFGQIAQPQAAPGIDYGALLSQLGQMAASQPQQQGAMQNSSTQREGRQFDPTSLLQQYAPQAAQRFMYPRGLLG